VLVANGLISPRPAELRQGLQNDADNQVRNIQIVAQGLASLHAPISVLTSRALIPPHGWWVVRR
jgi:hypothetical protein